MTAFAGLRVLDLSQGLAGPMAAMLLADFGAEVLKIEPPSGDVAKDLPGYLMWNRGKARLALDLDQPADRGRLAPLLAAADVAIFDHPPGRLAEIGLDAATLAAINPRLIHTWVPGFGLKGPWSHLPAHHAMLAGLTGAAFRQGSYADQPVWHIMPMIHYGQAVMAASATAAALLDRQRTGLGQSVAVSGVHGAAEVAGPVGLLDAPDLMQGHPLGGSASYRLYQCADGAWLFLATLFPHFFEKAIVALGLRQAAQDAPPGADIDRLIETVFRRRPRAEWLEILAAHDVPAAPVLDRRDWLSSGPLVDNALRVERRHPRLGQVEMPGTPVTLSRTPGAPGEVMSDAANGALRRFAEPRPAPPVTHAAPRPPLNGIRVLDLGTVIAGAYAGSILANFGADVVKIEAAAGDPFRPFGPGFTNHNRGKRGLGLDLKDPEGHAAFLDMARLADVVIDNYRLGVRERLGIDYAKLKAINPRLVSCSINAFGTAGADARRPGFDPLLQALSGMMAAQGGPVGEPVFHSVPVNDVATAAVASFAIIAALAARGPDGEGQNIETSLAAQSALFQSGDLTTWPGSPEPATGERDCIGLSALNRYYLCADGWITLGLADEDQATALNAALGGPDWRGRFPKPLSEPRRGALADEISAALSLRPRMVLLAALLAAGVPAAPVFRAEQARGEDWLWESGFFELCEHPAWGAMVASRAYADFSRGGGGFTRLDPGLGEHCVEVLRDYGFDAPRIRRLAEAGVIFRG